MKAQNILAWFLAFTPTIFAIEILEFQNSSPLIMSVRDIQTPGVLNIPGIDPNTGESNPLADGADGISASADGARGLMGWSLASGSIGGQVVWDLDTGEIVRQFSFIAGDGEVAFPFFALRYNKVAGTATATWSILRLPDASWTLGLLCIGLAGAWAARWPR